MSSMPSAFTIAVTLHILAVLIWVGGMFFAYMVLRPVAAGQLEPPARLTLWNGIFERFFPWVWTAIGTILGTGLWIIFGLFGGMDMIGLYAHLMFGLGLVMMAIFMFVYFVPYQALRQAVAAQDWPGGGQQLARIRTLVGFNTLLGLLTTAIAAGGRTL